MAIKINIRKELTDLLNTPRYDGDETLTLYIPEQRLKKFKDKVNYAITELYDRYHHSEGLKMYHILLSMSDFFEMKDVVSEVLNDENKEIVTEEMSQDYNVR